MLHSNVKPPILDIEWLHLCHFRYIQGRVSQCYQCHEENLGRSVTCLDRVKMVYCDQVHRVCMIHTV